MEDPVSPQTAEIMRQAMIRWPNGTATRMAIPGYEVGAKTGTAQFGPDPPASHAWIIPWAGLPGRRHVAVAVIVEDQSGAARATGGRVAAPIAKEVMAKSCRSQRRRWPARPYLPGRPERT